MTSPIGLITIMEALLGVEVPDAAAPPLPDAPPALPDPPAALPDAPPAPLAGVAKGVPKRVTSDGIGPGGADADAPCPTRAPMPWPEFPLNAWALFW